MEPTASANIAKERAAITGAWRSGSESGHDLEELSRVIFISLTILAAAATSPQLYPGWEKVGDATYERFNYMGPLRKSREPRIAGYGEVPINPADDSSCTPTYWTTEKVTSINYAYDFVIHSFT